MCNTSSFNKQTFEFGALQRNGALSTLRSPDTVIVSKCGAGLRSGEPILPDERQEWSGMVRYGQVAMFSAQRKENLPESLCRAIKVHMDLIYPINFLGYDKWIDSGYAINLAVGDVIIRDGEVVEKWRVVAYDPRTDDAGGRYEFIADDQEGATLSEEFAFLDSRISRGLALSNLTRAIEEWHKSQQK